MPVAVTDSSETPEIFKLFGITAEKYTLPLVAVGVLLSRNATGYRHTSRTRQEASFKSDEGSIHTNLTFSLLLTWLKLQLLPLRAHGLMPEKYRAKSPKDFYAKCIKLGRSRCAVLIVQDKQHFLDLQKFQI